MEHPNERTPNNVITSDTDNATTIQPKEAPPGKREKFRRFRAYNTDMWNGPRRENTESFRRQDDLHRYDSISSSLDLTSHQKDRGRNILDNFDPQTFGQSIDHIIFGICVVVANADVDGTRYWPTQVSESEPSCVFEEVAAEIGFGWKEQMSTIKKVKDRVDNRRTCLTIIRDNREQRPWEFNNLPVKTVDSTIKTGDYTLAELCDHDDDLDTYYPEYSIERKSGDDFVSSVGRNRSRFEKEIKRASDWDSPLLVLVEAPKEPSRYSNGHFLDYTDMDRSQIFGTVDSWERHYNVSFQFAGSRSKAQQIAYETLLSHLKAGLVSD